MTKVTSSLLISAFALKMIMAVLMLGDHLAYYLPQTFPFELRYAGRLVAPVFCYLMTVSLYHTRDRARYILRLATAGLLMFVGNMLLARALGGPDIFNGIFLSLAVAAALIDRIEQMRTSRSLLHLVVLVLLFVACFHIEGGFLMPIMALIFYYLQHRRLVMYGVYIAAGFAMTWAFGFQIYQQLMAFAVVPIMLFSGERGPDSAFAKWFFYIFYPLHVWALYAIRHFTLFA